MTEALELYHYWDSVCSYKVRMCLEEKGLAWSSTHVDLLKFEHLQPGYLALNPNGVVPTLVHGDRVINESSVINEYLDEVFPAVPLVPRDPFWRARMRIWVKYEDDVIHPSVRPGTFNLMIKSVVAGMSDTALADFVAAHPKPEVAADWVKAAREPVDRAAVAKASDKLAAALGRMEAALAQSEWLAGDTFSLADIAIAPMIERMQVLALAGLWRDMPNVGRWIAAVSARPSYLQAAPQQRMPGPAMC